MTNTFQALLVNENREAKLQTLSTDDLPDEAVLVDVEYSTLNFKDGLAVSGASPICQKLPMVCGIDLAGTVSESKDTRFNVGDKVLANGYGLSERHWGGYSQKQRVNPDFLLAVPAEFSTQQAMAIGTAGYTAMLCVNAIRDHGVLPGDGPILVTGSVGGVGSVAIMLLNALGYEVVAATGRPEQEGYLKKLGASSIVGREELARKCKPMEREVWAGVVDTVGSTTLATALSQVKYNGIAAVCGLAGGLDLPGNMMPFILRNVRLQGCDSVMAPMAVRARAWADLAAYLDLSLLAMATVVEPLSRVPALAQEIIQGKVKGRVVIDVNA